MINLEVLRDKGHCKATCTLICVEQGPTVKLKHIVQQGAVRRSFDKDAPMTGQWVDSLISFLRERHE